MDLKLALRDVDRVIAAGDSAGAIQRLRGLEASLAEDPELGLVRAELMRRIANLLQGAGNHAAAQHSREAARELVRDTSDGSMGRHLDALLLSDMGLGFQALADEEGAAASWEAALSIADGEPGCPDEVLAPILVNATAAAMIRIRQAPRDSTRDATTARRLAERAVEVSERNGDPGLVHRARLNAELVEGRVPAAAPPAEPHESAADLRIQSVLNQYRWHMAHDYHQSAWTLLEGEAKHLEAVQRTDLIVSFFSELARQRLAWRRPLSEIRAAARQAIWPLEALRDGSGPYGIETKHLRVAADVAYQVLGFALLEQNHVDESFEVLERGRARRLCKDQLGGIDTSVVEIPADRMNLIGKVRARIRRVTARARRREPKAPVRDLVYDPNSLPALSAVANVSNGSDNPPEVEEAHQELVGLMKDLFKDFPRVFRRDASPVRSLPEIRASLRSSEILLYPIEVVGRLFLLTATTESAEVMDVTGTGTSAAVNAALARCQEGLCRPSTNYKQLEVDLEELGETLLGKAAPLLTDRTTLLWCPPAGPLGTIPLAALRIGDRYVAERWQTVHLPLSALICSSNTRDTVAELVALGNPEGNLPGAQSEVAEIAALYTGTVATGADATPAFLRDHARPGGIAHLACHGKFERDVPGLSKLILAPSDDEGLGLLFASDVASLGLDLSMVVLSACQSALLGSVGSEEVGGFGLSFLLQGADSVVAGLWNVGDRPTHALMTRFYRHLTGHTKAEALRRATVELLRDRRYEHPSLWSPFVLMGDWRGRARPRSSEPTN